MASGTNWKRPWEDDGRGQYPYFARRMSVPAAYTTSHIDYGSAPLSRSPQERKLPPITSAIDLSARPPGAARQPAFTQRTEETNGVRRPLTPPDFRKRAWSQYGLTQESHPQRRPSEPVRVKSNGLGHSSTYSTNGRCSLREKSADQLIVGFLAQIDEQRKPTSGMPYHHTSLAHGAEGHQIRNNVTSRDKVSRDSSMSPPAKQCQNCKRVGDPIREVVLGLMQLNQELRLANGSTGYPDLQVRSTIVEHTHQTIVCICKS